jgi:sugar (pentulose or hexulose) kinase
MNAGLENNPSTLVLDVGKTHVKVLVMSETGSVLDVAKLNNESIEGPPYTHFDTEGIWQWLLSTVNNLADKNKIRAIVSTTHGCAAALVDGRELVFPVLDYEDEIPNETSETFKSVVPAFAETQTPNLPGGQNLGRQLFWFQRKYPKEFLRVKWILTYPQYWAWRLSGVAASELTSIGCHAYLWNPHKKCYSTLVDEQGWASLFPPIRPAYEALGPILPEVAQKTGLAPECQVYNGIHDSNAAYSLYLRGRAKPFSLISTGTWVIIFSPRFPVASLNEARDTLANVNLRGEPLPTARYMGGREFEILSREAGTGREFTEANLRKVIAKKSFILPSYAQGGPFMNCKGSTYGPECELSGEILARATLYVALVTLTSMRMLNVDSDLIISGSFVNNPWYCRLLATLGGCERCYIDYQSESTAVGAGMLASWDDKAIESPLNLTRAEKFEDPGLMAYVEEWQNLSG